VQSGTRVYLYVDYDMASNWGNWQYISGGRFRGGYLIKVSREGIMTLVECR
jgi:hypothetical protein